MMKTVHSLEEMDAFKKKNGLVLVYFGSSTCGVCRELAPKLERMLEQYPGVQAVRVEAQSLPELCAGYGVFSVPAILLFILGKETIREAGIISLVSLEQKIARYYGLFYGSD